jgi:hypothetical protein
VAPRARLAVDRQNTAVTMAVGGAARSPSQPRGDLQINLRMNAMSDSTRCVSTLPIFDAESSCDASPVKYVFNARATGVQTNGPRAHAPIGALTNQSFPAPAVRICQENPAYQAIVPRRALGRFASCTHARLRLGRKGDRGGICDVIVKAGSVQSRGKTVPIICVFLFCAGPGSDTYPGSDTRSAPRECHNSRHRIMYTASQWVWGNHQVLKTAICFVLIG